MKRILFLSLIALFPLFLVAETVQKGRVVLQNSKGKGLSGVQIIAPRAVPVQTGNKGEFTLVYTGVSAGGWAGISEVYKKGYEIVNADEVRNWVLSPKSELVIVMCPEGSLQQARERYYLSGASYYKMKYDETLSMLSKQKEQNQISADKYWEDIQNAGKELDRAMGQLNKMSERLSVINIDDLSKTEKKVWQLLDEEKFEEALDVFEKEQLKSELSLIIPSMRRYVDLLMFAGGEENVAKAERAFQQVALVAPEDFEVQFDYGYFLKNRIDFSGSIEYLEKALLAAENDLQRAKVYREMGQVYNYARNYEKAEETLNKSYELYLALAQELSPVYYLKCAESLNYLGNLYYLLHEYTKGFEVLKKGLELLDYQEERGSYDYLYQKGSLQGTLGAIYYRNIEHNKRENIEETERNLTEAVHIWSELTKIDPHGTNKILTTCLSNLGSFYSGVKADYATAEKYLLEAIEMQEEVDRKYPLMLRNNLSFMYRNLANIYGSMNNKELTFKYLDKTVAIDEEMVQINHRSFAASQLATFGFYAGALNVFGEYEKAVQMSMKTIDLITPLVKEDRTTYYITTVISHWTLMVAYTKLERYAEAVKTILPIRYLIEDKDLFAKSNSQFTKPLKFVYDIKVAGLISEQEQDEEVKEIFEFVSGYFKEEQ